MFIYNILIFIYIYIITIFLIIIYYYTKTIYINFCIKIKGDFTFDRPGEYEFTLRATLNVQGSTDEHIWWAGRDGQNGKIIVKQASNRYEKDIKTLNDVLIPTEPIEVELTKNSDPNILYSGFMKIPLYSLIVSKFYPVDLVWPCTHQFYQL